MLHHTAWRSGGKEWGHVCRFDTCALLLRNNTLKMTIRHGREPYLCTLVGQRMSYALGNKS